MKKFLFHCAFFIEDESALDYLNDLLSKVSFISSISIVHDSFEAIGYLNKNKPSILFLDTKHVDLLQSVHKPPFIIGVCDHSNAKNIKKYLSKGFFDIIFTPITEKQCHNILGKILNIYDTYHSTQKEDVFVAAETDLYSSYNNQQNTPSNDIIFLKKDNELTPFNTHNIVYLSRKQNHLFFLFENGFSTTIKKTLKHYLAILPEEIFQKINKDTIINVEHVDKIIRNDTILVGNKIFVISRAFKKAFFEKIKR